MRSSKINYLIVGLFVLAMIGALVLKEPFGRTRIAAAAAVACGAVLLNVGG